MLLWLWHRLAAVALIRPLAWEPPYAADAALKKKKLKNFLIKKKTKDGPQMAIKYMKKRLNFINHQKNVN